MARTSNALRRQPDGNGSPVANGQQHDRFTGLEAAVAMIQNTLEVQFKRMASMQAEIDHLTAKSRS